MMKTRLFCMFVFSALLIFAVHNSDAQGVNSGVVKYEQTTKYDFESLFKLKNNTNPEVRAWLAGIPKQSKKLNVLYFTETVSLYEEDDTAKPPPNKNLREAMAKAMYFKEPEVEVEKVFRDFGKSEMTRQVLFMTRYFTVKDSIRQKPWKFNNKMAKVLDYTCMGAELAQGGTTFTAWFTPEIPVSTGPDQFYGLPGLILAIEVNGETAIIATSIEFTVPNEEILKRPDKDMNLSQEEFDRIVADKIKEYREAGGKKIIKKGIK
ncbi:GLPGLI family protein [candidate division KSB1 bacterium]